ncbi:MAG: PKD domain-containing protein [Candidatus Bathyarchaeota archaeon]
MRIGFGALAALVATLVVNLKVGAPIMNGITVGLAVYLVSYYVLKWLFMSKVEKPTKILTMGIGAYALTFVFCWVLFVTPFLAPPTATFTMTPDQGVVGEAITFSAAASVDPDGKIVSYVWNFGDENITTAEVPTITHSYAVASEYTVRLQVVDDHGIGSINTANLTVSAPS